MRTERYSSYHWCRKATQPNLRNCCETRNKQVEGKARVFH